MSNKEGSREVHHFEKKKETHVHSFFFFFNRPFTSATSLEQIDWQGLGEREGAWWKRRKGVGTEERWQKKRGRERKEGRKG